jgi:hypothetical protein
MQVKCSHTSLVAIESLKVNPKNPNTHNEDQIILLSKILKTQGWRSPIVVSNLSGFIVKGHGRLEAAKLAGFSQVPVDYQDYETEEMEISDLIADNRIAELSDFDNRILKDLIEQLDTGANDLDLTGFDSPNLDMLMSQFHQDTVDEAGEYTDMPVYDQQDGVYRKIVVSFENEQGVKDFKQKLGASKITDKTLSMWHPWKDRENTPIYE